jgi:hypothetical protein
VIETAIISNPQHSVHLALVCKLFQKWVTPLLYRDVALCGEEAFDKFLETMTSNPSLGRSVSGFWVGPLSTESFASADPDWELKLMPRLESGLVYIVSCTPHLKRLALINLPRISQEDWLEIEAALPSGLEYLAAGPDHIVEFDEPAHFPSLKWLCSIDRWFIGTDVTNLCEMKQLQNFHWCFIEWSINLHSVRCLTHLLASRPWNSICLYLIEGGDILSTDFPEDLRIELAALYEDKRVKTYQLFQAEDWTKALFRYWTEDWVRSGS